MAEKTADEIEETLEDESSFDSDEKDDSGDSDFLENSDGSLSNVDTEDDEDEEEYAGPGAGEVSRYRSSDTRHCVERSQFGCNK
ncbi:hypothetical protein RvY_14397 [Ramazzottius varieornatus]|uniref:Uncharacterized protein n=1 Tax=Ramazzottius varieornatus TaxID=947166 RepID=A0A1D1VW85_RAMVA|nr:hypothetical protein RvY_14397 [Ramazzottius varieornatus]